MSGLPPRLEAVIEEVVRRSGLTGAQARELRADLESHFEDGLAAGRTPEALMESFGDPRSAARDIAEGMPPSPRRAPVRSPSTFSSLAGDLVTDIRHGIRAMLQRPATALTSMLVLALGLGANTVVFTIVSELVLRPLPVDQPETLVDVWPDVPGGNSFLGFSWTDYTAYRDGAGTLETLAAFAGARLHGGDLGEGETLIGQVVSPEYFPMMGLEPHLGSMRFPPGAAFGEDPSVVLSHALWRDRLGADPSVLGRTVRLDGTPVTVLGVAPSDFRGHFIGFPIDLWLPISAAPTFLPGFDPADPASKPLEMIGRLRPGVGLEAAAEELDQVSRRLEARYPDLNRGHRVGVTRTTGLDHSLRASVDTFIAILVVVSGLVLVIACLNVGSVLLVRTLARERDMAIRLAIGAGYGRLVRQLLTEAALLVSLGVVCGTWLASALNGWLADLVRRLSGGVGPELAIDWRALVLTGGAALAASLLAGGAPTLHVLGRDPAGALRAREGDRGTAARLRSALVVGQVAVSVVLVTATGLFVRSLMEGTHADPGFDAERVASFTLDLERSDVAPQARGAALQELLEQLGAIPGVEGVTVSDAPVVGVARTPVDVDVPGVEPPSGQDAWTVDAHAVGAGHLTTLGIPLRAGRDLRAEDEIGAAPVAVVNRAFMDRFWPDRDAVGRSLRLDGQDVRVVGVAEDARYLVQDDTPDPLVYRSRVGTEARARITVRAARPSALTAAVRDRVAEAVPGHGPVSLIPASEILRNALLPQRLGALLVGGMGLVALFLSGVGLYGLVHFTVSRTTHELGVRLALGGSRRDLVGVVLRKGFLLVAAGIALGLALAVPTGRALRGFLGEVSPTDPITYGVVVLVFGVVALAASWAPAMRAAAVSPTEALRGE